MKKKIIKIASVSLCIAALCVCLLVPVSAANVSGENASSDLFLPLAFVEEGNNMRYGICMIAPTNSVDSDLVNIAYPYYYSKNAVGSFQFANLMENYKRVYGYLRSYALQFEIINGFIEKGDTYNFKTVVALQYAYGEYEPIKGNSGDYLAIGVYSNGDRVGEIPINVSPTTGDMSNIGWDYYSVEANGLYNGADGDQLRLEIQVSALLPSSDLYNLNAIGVQFSKDSVYAAGSGANAPIYKEPDTGKLDEYEDAENQVLDNAQEGIDTATDLFGSFSLSDFADSMLGVVAIYNYILPKMDWLQALINISLALGFFSFLVGTAQFILGRVHNTERAKNPVRQDAQYIKRDGIAAHRPSRR